MNTGKNSEKESRVGDRNIVESSASTREESRMVGMDTSSDNTNPKHKRKARNRKKGKATGNQRQARARARYGAHGEGKEAADSHNVVDVSLT